MLPFLILFAASVWAGAQNALAGGGSFLTLPALIAAGMDARAANITSTIALFPAQIVTGYTGRSGAAGLPSPLAGEGREGARSGAGVRRGAARA